MNMGKGFTKSKIIVAAIVALVVIALVVTMVFVFKGSTKDTPTGADLSSQTDVSSLFAEDEESSNTDLPEAENSSDYGNSSDSVGSSEPTDSSDYADSSKPTNSSNSAVSSDLADSSKPADSSNPTESSSKPAASSDSVASSEPADTTDTKTELFTVTFVDFDGTVLNTQKVEKGKSATEPTKPVRENFEFAGWDKAFNKITSDLVVTATYTTTKTVIYAEHVSVNKGTSEVTMKLRVINNPGIMGAVLKVSVDDKVLSFKSANKTEYPGLTLTSPGSKVTASPYTFMLDSLELSKEDKKDGTLFTITFKVADTAAIGKYGIELSCDNGAIFDEDYKYPKICLENGSITIK